eukprot:CAMPEP_0171455128 /NCGR_PEP_ID=MMETSP0945-20130129/2147_1 /TAXON_ID=109269 /ORGANISM="Vaucheria litorea, Strain CCMP2940" /LENGTH=220 /DNA_ID=CAMNT_0011980307 /DNA_START=460 /DNA_END=1122 /DNA_ORIENTATION=-
MADRIKIARGAKGPDINLSVQAVINCAAQVSGTCHGGNVKAVYEWANKNPVPFDTCQQYKAIDDECSAINTCRTCWSFDEKCEAVEDYPFATISEFGSVIGEKEMMAEIYQRGPIGCDINADPLHDYENGIVDLPDVSDETDHDVSIIGWGETEEGVPYWIVRNSWGEYWGEQGWFRIVRGQNQLLIESNCAWGVPGTWTEVSNHGSFLASNGKFGIQDH